MYCRREGVPKCSPLSYVSIEGLHSLGSLTLGSSALAGDISRVETGVGGTGGVVNFRTLSILTNAAYITLVIHLLNLCSEGVFLGPTISPSNNLSVPSFSSSVRFSCDNLASSAVSAANASFTFVKARVDALCPARIRFFARSSAISGSVNPRTKSFPCTNRKYYHF